MEAKPEIKLEMLDGCREFTRLTADTWDIVYILEGMGICYFDDGKSLTVREGFFLLISPQKSFRIVSLPPDSKDCIRLCAASITREYMRALAERAAYLFQREFELPEKLSDNKEFYIYLNDVNEIISKYLLAAEYEYANFSDAGGTIIDNSVLNLIICITRLYDQHKGNIQAEKNETVDDLIKYIKTNFGGNLSLNYLAAYAHLSPGYLSRYFKLRTGKKLSDFITETRIEKAKHKLRTSGWSVNSVCEYCGYKTISSFQKAFKNSTGMTAGEYRIKNGII